MIAEHQCGIAVPPDDPSAFADAVTRLRDDREAARRMGARGRKLAETQFSRGRLSERFVKTLEHVYASSRE
jgi:glycosyltransferase involved in cell wall biosynthesis